MIFITRGTWKCFITANTFSERMWFALDWELKTPEVHLKPPPLQCEVSASWFRAQNPPLPLKPSMQCMEVWCQWRPSADGSSDSPQLPTNSPEVRTSPNFPTCSAVLSPKVIIAPKTKIIASPPQKHSLYELPPACEPAAPELELLAIHGPTKLQSGHFALFRYEKRNILCHGGKKSKSEWSSVTFPGGDRSLQKKSRGRRFWQKKKKIPGRKIPCR